MKTLTFDNAWATCCPAFVGAALSARIRNSLSSPALWDEIAELTARLRRTYTPDAVKDIPSIRATREAYRRCGKDPSRYRPSGEALMRRLLKGNDLYRVNTAVDLINLASLRYGYSIGGFDEERIEGDTLCLGIGRADEPYEGIGRGSLNIEGLPVYRDGAGGIGTPTSDHERTKLHTDSRRLLALVNGYDGDRKQVMACAHTLANLLQRHAEATDIDIRLFNPLCPTP